MVRQKVVQAQTELVKWMQEAMRECKEQSLEPAIQQHNLTYWQGSPETILADSG